MPSSGVESWTVVGPDARPVPLVDEFLGWLTGIERSPNTVEAYARDLAAFWSFLAGRGVAWDRVSVAEMGEFAAWARRPAENVLVLSELAARRSASTVNRMLAAVIDCQRRLRDRFLFALLASTGMRVGQALGLRHEDVVSWERRIEIVPREDDLSRARSKGGAHGSVPVPGELIRLWSDYMHEEYGAVESDFVFVNLWGGERGRPLSYAAVNELVVRTRRLLGFHFTAHMLRHTFATLAYRDGVALEVVGAVLTHRSRSSTLIYTHLTAEDLRAVLAERGVLDRVADLLT